MAGTKCEACLSNVHVTRTLYLSSTTYTNTTMSDVGEAPRLGSLRGAYTSGATEWILANRATDSYFSSRLAQDEFSPFRQVRSRMLCARGTETIRIHHAENMLLTFSAIGMSSSSSR